MAEATETTETLPRENESQVFRASTERWMSKLQEALPNPSLASTNETAQQETTETTETKEETKTAETTETAPKVQTETKQETKTETKTEEDKERWPRSRQEWKKFTDARKAKDADYEKQIAERDATIKELQAKTADSPAVAPEFQKKLDELQKENEEYSKQLRLVAVTNHPRFKAHFDKEVAAALAPLKNCVPADQLDAVTKLVQAPDSEAKEEAIERLLEGMTTLGRGRFVGVINSLAAIQAERDNEITRAQQDYDQMMAQAKTERERQQTAFNKQLEDTVKGMQDAKSGRPEYQLREGETEWNNSVTKRIELGKKLITGNLSPETMFKAAFDAAAYPDVLMGYRSALAEVDKLKKQIAAMSAKSPKVESTARTETNGKEPALVLPQGARPQERMTAWVKKFGEAMQGSE